jgi:hypothetical protein
LRQSGPVKKGCGITVVVSNFKGVAYAFWGIALSSAYLITVGLFFGGVLLT